MTTNNKEMQKIYSRRYNKKHPERVILSRKKSKDKRKDKIKQYNKEYWQKWYKKNRQKRKDYQNTGIGRFKQQARGKVYNAIKTGKLKRQNCSVTNCNKIGEAHHSDYTKPFNILWLCAEHHRQLDRTGNFIKVE